VAKVVIPYKPRAQFEAYHDREERFAKIVAHRRFGKTVGCINDKIRAALTIDCSNRAGRPPRFAYIAPTYSQAKDVAWSYLKYYSAPIPGLQMSESELWVEYPNGARIRLYGADNYDRLRGFTMMGSPLTSLRKWTLELGPRSFAPRYLIMWVGDLYRNSRRTRLVL